MTASARVVPELALADPVAGAAMLHARMGFQRFGTDADGALRVGLGSQIVRIVSSGAEPPSPIVHLALAVPDVDAALGAVIARGGALDRAITPNGPLEIPEFGPGGFRYAFCEGPEGARIELCARPGAPVRMPGHDHIGIACREFEAMRGFLLVQGFAERSAVVLKRPEGEIPVSFMVFGESTVELYRPPQPEPLPAGAARWRALVIDRGTTGTAALGPEGLLLRPFEGG
jgi:catechol 2,3-dioxygenase-like lactoylglutathione lyase family enzyme